MQPWLSSLCQRVREPARRGGGAAQRPGPEVSEKWEVGLAHQLPIPLQVGEDEPAPGHGHPMQAIRKPSGGGGVERGPQKHTMQESENSKKITYAKKIQLVSLELCKSHSASHDEGGLERRTKAPLQVAFKPRVREGIFCYKCCAIVRVGLPAVIC